MNLTDNSDKANRVLLNPELESMTGCRRRPRWRDRKQGNAEVVGAKVLRAC
jgi:hypothetical protein